MMTSQQQIDDLQRRLRSKIEQIDAMEEKCRTSHILTLDGWDKATRWNRSFNDVKTEIVFWGEGQSYRPRGSWNFYIYIHERQLSEEDFAKVWLSNTTPSEPRPTYACYSSVLSVDGWNGEITFYEKTITNDAHRLVKVGCDYGHVWDEECPPTLERVALDAERTVTELCKVLRFKRRCEWDGSWDYPENMVDHKGRLYTKAGLADMLAKHPEWSK